ncbi:MAG: DUF4105 domain-containing protein [Gemmatimonadaceae bacterium]|nr:DUF4105 domain-containing protein [Gemmatimonadaceae bacterium]
MPTRFFVPVMRRSLHLAMLLFGLAILVWSALQLRRPSTDRDWTADNARMPEVAFAGSAVTVKNVRNFDWQTTTGFTPRWEDRSYDLDRLESVWFLVEPFGDFRGPAHTFVSFGFADSLRGTDYVAVSVELRKEVGESYHPVRGLFREYELAYVVGDERDLVRLRSNVRRDSVFLYRVQATPEQGRTLFRAMLERADRLRTAPEFYNTLWSSCTTNIVDHVNAISPSKVPFSYKVLLPAYADELAYDIGLLDTTRTFATLRGGALINPVAMAAHDDPDFSARIRAGLR